MELTILTINDKKGKMRKLFILSVVPCLFFSCIDIDSIRREDIVDKESLWDYDYRLFQSTPAWELAKAVQDGNEDRINGILAKNADLVDFQESNHGMTLLMMTINNQRKVTLPYSMICANQQCGLKLNENQWRSFLCLLKNGASVDITNKYGDSPLTIACSCDYYDQAYVRKLIEYGANVNFIYPDSIVSRIGNATPLLNAVRCRQLGMVKLLVKNGAEVNYIDRFGNTALGIALCGNEYDIALYLLENGADYTIPVSKRYIHTLIAEKEDSSMLRIEEELRYATWPLNSESHKSKMKVVDYLHKNNINYKAVPIPEEVVEYAKKNYPNDWEAYLNYY